MPTGPLCPLICVSLFISSSASAEWYARQSHTSAQGKQAVTELRYAQHRLRIDTPEEPSVIINLHSGDMTMLDHKNKRYARATLQDLVDMRNKMKAQIEARIASMPESMQKGLKKMLEEQEMAMKKNLEIKKTGKSGKIIGVACDYFRWKGPDGDGEACVAQKAGVDLSGFQKDAAILSTKLKASGAGTNAATSMELLQLASKGFPLKTKRVFKVGPKTIEATSEVTELKPLKVAPKTMKPPAGYTSVPFEKFIQSQAPLMSPR